MFLGPRTLLTQSKKLFPIYQRSFLQESETSPPRDCAKH